MGEGGSGIERSGLPGEVLAQIERLAAKHGWGDRIRFCQADDDDREAAMNGGRPATVFTDSLPEPGSRPQNLRRPGRSRSWRRMPPEGLRLPPAQRIDYEFEFSHGLDPEPPPTHCLGTTRYRPAADARESRSGVSFSRVGAPRWGYRSLEGPGNVTRATATRFQGTGVVQD